MKKELRDLVDEVMEESKSYLQMLNTFIIIFSVLTVAGIVSLLYSFDIWTLICTAASSLVVFVALFKKNKLFGDLDGLTKEDGPAHLL